MRVDREDWSDLAWRKVNLRILNVAYNMLGVTLPVRSVLLPGPRIGRGPEAEVREELTRVAASERAA